MAKTASSRQWLLRQQKDPYVIRAQREGYPSRAAYKLLEIQERDRLLASGMNVLDLGAAPGSWSRIAARLVGARGCVIALDLLPMEVPSGVTFLQCDFREQEALVRLDRLLEGRQLDLVLSDMAPNLSGVGAVDQPRSMYLAELALDLALERLKPGGAFVVKVFQGEGFDRFLAQIRARFASVASRKPKASRAESRELYLVAKRFRDS